MGEARLHLPKQNDNNGDTMGWTAMWNREDNKMDETKMADNKMETRWMITSSSQVVHTIVNMISLL